MRYAIRITDGQNTRLFAVVGLTNTTKFRNLAKQSITSGSSEWVTIAEWV